MGNGHEIRFDYQSNIAIDSVRLYRAQTSWNPNLGLYGINLLLDGYYADNQLFKTITKNENWTSGNLNTTLEFKDKDGRVILKRCYAYNNKGIIDRHDTYYVYDIYGNLTYVIPPAAGDITITGVLDELCYQYKYDSRNRLVEKNYLENK
ncbi:MAG: hypothetical protein M0D53_01300 [Flavobacterium sp. JAD_PAG50586_2]|nr:MAG: hypothetical protein M0D53_01300 [Flavobacterium sp. JAD_PAG50586_2]